MLGDLIDLLRSAIRVWRHKPGEMDFVDEPDPFLRWGSCLLHFLGLAVFGVGTVFVAIRAIDFIIELLMRMVS